MEEKFKDNEKFASSDDIIERTKRALTKNYPAKCIFCKTPINRALPSYYEAMYKCPKCGFITLEMVLNYMKKDLEKKRLQYKKRSKKK